jgi:hypothetical protein
MGSGRDGENDCRAGRPAEPAEADVIALPHLSAPAEKKALTNCVVIDTIDIVDYYRTRSCSRRIAPRQEAGVKSLTQLLNGRPWAWFNALTVRRARRLLTEARSWAVDIAWRFGGHAGGWACVAALDIASL